MARVNLSREEINLIADRIVEARLREARRAPFSMRPKEAEEGGCGVVGFACSEPVSGRHIFEPCIQMHNRGNGKGGGIACACLDPQQMGVDAATLRDDYILQIALIDDKAENEVETGHISPYFEIHHKSRVEAKADHRDLGLDPKPPDVTRYFVRVKPKVLAAYADEIGLSKAPSRQVEDEFVYRNSGKINEAFYTSLGDKRAFVMSPRPQPGHIENRGLRRARGAVLRHGGLQGPHLDRPPALSHQGPRVASRRVPIPSSGLNEALVHNGDFANYLSVCEYLKQHGITTQFLTDTEVSVLLFDLWTRVYNYPLEYVIEAMAPTTELDFNRLPGDKQATYRAIQSMHIHGSPDGPWFFIIARSQPDLGLYQLMGITDTAMLRPQVFALQEGDVTIGLVASEKQAIDATLSSLNKEDPRFRQVADRYWNARGGSATDGGAFVFNVKSNGEKAAALTCADKFGRAITAPPGRWSLDPKAQPAVPAQPADLEGILQQGPAGQGAAQVFGLVAGEMAAWDFSHLQWFLSKVEAAAQKGEEAFAWALEILTLLNDRRYGCGDKRRSMVLATAAPGHRPAFGQGARPDRGQGWPLSAHRLAEQGQAARPPGRGTGPGDRRP